MDINNLNGVFFDPLEKVIPCSDLVHAFYVTIPRGVDRKKYK